MNYDEVKKQDIKQMQKMSKTPRTDALLDKLDERSATDKEGALVLLAHAQMLEEELYKVQMQSDDHAAAVGALEREIKIAKGQDTR